MATIVLTAVGTLLGGPIGGAIGAALGSRIDTAVLGSGKPREGPRLKELELQTSSYGTQVPAIFGAMRVAGTVIWSTDLIERRVKSGGGKGRPSSVNYSYSASFAVALSSRPLVRIGRIWADGNLLRGAAGDFKVETDFRLHGGHKDQPLDPLLGSVEASGQCPAYRGLAYVVFEDLQLADFGNRIPSLTFEVFERVAPVPVVDIARLTSGGLIGGQASASLIGFAAQGRDCRSALEPILAAMPVIVRPDEDGFILNDWSAPVSAISFNDVAISDGKTNLDRPGRSRQGNGSAPYSVSIRHYDPARDFQAGTQASRQIESTRADMQIDLPASLNADVAKGFAELQLLQRWRGLNGRSLSLPMSAGAIAAGMSMSDQASALRITEIEHFRGTTRILAREWSNQSLATLAADPGRNQAEPDLSAGTTRLMLVDLPALGSDDSGRPSLAIAAAGTAAGWRRASLSIRDGDRTIELGGTNGIATIGQLLGGLPTHTPMLLDYANQPVIRLLNDAMILPTGTGDPMSFDAPSIWIGEEILRYGSAEKIGPRDYRLGNLLRGCFGTGAPMPVHADGAECLLLEQDSMLLLNAVPTPIGSLIELEALGIGDAVPVERSLLVEGNGIRPRRPVHGRIERPSGSEYQLIWVRRDRLSYGWTDSADIPNSEGFGEFAVELFVGGTQLASWIVSNESLLISATDILTLSLPTGSILDFAVTQQGQYARSAPLLLQTTL